MEVVDENYCFKNVSTRYQGRLSGGGVFANCQFKKMFHSSNLNLPAARYFPGRNSLTRYVFIANDAFPLLPNIMKQYPGIHDKGSSERVYNGRLSGARTVVENVFGISSVVFSVFRKPMLLEPDKASRRWCAHVHTYITFCGKVILQIGTAYPPPPQEHSTILDSLFKVEVLPSETLLKLKKVPRKPSTEAKSIQKEFASYFECKTWKVS
ncbi:hypothetical protein PR048_006344 [Dryococelus australis]|uniref:DDE Tnp4 domain-containing protein n=1 Tax=Dryococelus australis TaxID=614101 RepID=A0ABQ9IAQ4_9NEOP|nr:hypothetical protein PR048_006344 [Dryococelus australis]